MKSIMLNLIFLSLSLPVMANTVKFEFSGYIDIINSNENNALGNVYLNQPFNGWFSYSSVPDKYPDPSCGAYSQDASISVTLGTQVISYIDDYVIIVVWNNDYNGADSFLHGVDATQGDFNFTYFGIDLSDSTGMVYNNDDLPMSFNLTQFDSTRLRIAGYKYPGHDWFSIRGEITNMTLVPEPATTYYVDADEGSDDNDGLTPETAFATIQKAIDSAYNGDTVLVADGTYTGPGNRDIDFLGKAITVRSENGPDNCIIDCNATPYDRHCGFYFQSGENANSILAGFTVTNGYAEYRGGGIYCEESNPTITNCIISGNSAQVGGGIYCEQSSPTITDCTINGNFSYAFGGGIYCYDNSSPTITNCAITDNSAAIDGGGICCYFGSDLIITNCTISGNSANDDGGGMRNNSSSPTLTNCTFTGNSAYYLGGGICNWSGSPTVTNCTFSGNSANYGGGMLNDYSSSPTLTNCTFTGNSAYYLGGGICNWSGSPTITNCTFSGNWGGDGGGIYSYGSSPTITNCTFAENSSPNGSALACDSWAQMYPSSVQLTNCILWGSGNEIWNNDGSTITITYSDIQDGYEGEGNIDADPCFVEPGYWDANYIWIEGDYYLLPDSPCIDSGDNNSVPADIHDLDGDGNTAEPLPFDLDGNPRVIGDAIDMGAYETNYIQAAMRLTPQTLNCASKGKYIKAHFVLPEGFLPEDVDVNEPAIAEPMGAESEYIRVFGNNEGPVRLEICFDREAFCETITETGEVEITVIGSLTAGRYFYATNTIKMKPRR